MSEETVNKRDKDKPYATQQKAGFRENYPEWMKQLPRLKFPDQPNPDYHLINREELRRRLVHVDRDALVRIEEDLGFLEHELLRLFRTRDYEASQQQNRYRLYQLGFMGLAALAGLIGSLQALSLSSNPGLVPIFALAETIVALMTTYLATISGREPPLPIWLTNRRRAETLRREYFRYLLNIEPYDKVDGYTRKTLLSTRAADINRGVAVEEESQ